mmetsp:Transcript_24779/g.45442  ORF Transcript_24779/g.45442 Transcript_24779/m.45442 type:complete len:209 (-) Transcript_24779:393-1019(-)
MFPPLIGTLGPTPMHRSDVKARPTLLNDPMLPHLSCCFARYATRDGPKIDPANYSHRASMLIARWASRNGDPNCLVPGSTKLRRPIGHCAVALGWALSATTPSCLMMAPLDAVAPDDCSKIHHDAIHSRANHSGQPEEAPTASPKWRRMGMLSSNSCALCTCYSKFCESPLPHLEPALSLESVLPVQPAGLPAQLFFHPAEQAAGLGI